VARALVVDPVDRQTSRPVLDPDAATIDIVERPQDRVHDPKQSGGIAPDKMDGIFGHRFLTSKLPIPPSF
jgi:hypothetical protein